MFDEKSLFIQRMETKNSQLLLRYNSKLSFEPVAVSAKESFPPVWRGPLATGGCSAVGTQMVIGSTE